MKGVFQKVKNKGQVDITLKMDLFTKAAGKMIFKMDRENCIVQMD